MSYWATKYVSLSYGKIIYYGIMSDTMLDVSHNEKIPEIIRFVDVNNESKIVVVKEGVIDFIKIHEKAAESVTEEVNSKLERNGHDLNDRRRQA